MSLTIREGRELAAELLAASGLPPDAAGQTAQALVLADVWGVSSHGLMRLPFYLERLQAGGCRADATLRTVSDTGPVVSLDGQDGLGHWQLWRAAELARDRCARGGIAAVAVGRSSHCGALGVYTVPPLAAGMIALVFSHGPAVMPPWGGTAAVLSTSPIAGGIPSRPRPAIIDLATSAVARGRIKTAAQRGETLAPGWAFTADGEPTTDPAAALAGMLAPLGGAKGYALAFLVEALTAAAVGPQLSADVPDMFDPADAARPQRIAHLVVALDPAALSIDPAVNRFDELAARVDATGGRLPGSRRVLPEDIDENDPLGLAPSTRAELERWQRRLSA